MSDCIARIFKFDCDCELVTQDDSTTAGIDWNVIDFTKSQPRGELARHGSRKWSSWVCFQLTVPMLAAIGYFGGMVMIGMTTSEQYEIDAATTYKSEMREVCPWV